MHGAAAPTVFLHIGTPKSGTTYLQQLFERNCARAASQGLLWPGPDWDAHVEAARELRRLRHGQALDPDGPWSRLSAEVRSWTGDRVLVSMEWLASCSAHQVGVAVESLRPCRVEVVCTARDLLRTFVAQWQEMTKNYRPWSWDRFVTDIVDEDPSSRVHSVFWRQQDAAAILGRWARVVPVDRIHLVTVPPSGADPGLLGSRFCDLLGVDDSGFEPPDHHNESLGVVSTLLMHRLNLVARTNGLSHARYKRVVHRAVGLDVLAPRRAKEDAISVSPGVDAWLRERSVRLVDEIRALGVHEVGDLDELLPGRALVGREPGDVSDGELLDLCAEVLVTLAARQQDEIAGLRRRLQRRAPPEPGGEVRERIVRRLRYAGGRLRRH